LTYEEAKIPQLPYRRRHCGLYLQICQYFRLIVYILRGYCTYIDLEHLGLHQVIDYITNPYKQYDKS